MYHGTTFVLKTITATSVPSTIRRVNLAPSCTRGGVNTAKGWSCECDTHLCKNAAEVPRVCPSSLAVFKRRYSILERDDSIPTLSGLRVATYTFARTGVGSHTVRCTLGDPGSRVRGRPSQVSLRRAATANLPSIVRPEPAKHCNCDCSIMACAPSTIDGAECGCCDTKAAAHYQRGT